MQQIQIVEQDVPTLGAYDTTDLLVGEVPVANRNALGRPLLVNYNIYPKFLGANIRHMI